MATGKRFSFGQNRLVFDHRRWIDRHLETQINLELGNDKADRHVVKEKGAKRSSFQDGGHQFVILRIFLRFKMQFQWLDGTDVRIQSTSIL